MFKKILIFALNFIFISYSNEIPTISPQHTRQLASQLFRSIALGDQQQIQTITQSIEEVTDQQCIKNELLNRDLRLHHYTFTHQTPCFAQRIVFDCKITAICCASDNRTVCFGLANGICLIYDTHTKTIRSRKQIFSHPISHIDWSPDGILVLVSQGKGVLYNPDTDNMQPLSLESYAVSKALWYDNSTLFLISENYDEIGYMRIERCAGAGEFLQEYILIGSGLHLGSKNNSPAVLVKNKRYVICYRQLGRAINVLDMKTKEAVTFALPNIFDTPCIYHVALNPYKPEMLVCYHDEYEMDRRNFLINIPHQKIIDTLERHVISPGIFIGPASHWINDHTVLFKHNQYLMAYDFNSQRVLRTCPHIPPLVNIFCQNESPVVSCVSPGMGTSKSLHIYHGILKRSIELVSDYATYRLKIFYAPLLKYLLALNEEENYLDHIDTSGLLAENLTCKQIILLEYLFHHKDHAKAMLTAHFWKSAYETLPTNLKNICKSLQSDCTIL